jgi:hypothetical protein
VQGDVFLLCFSWFFTNNRLKPNKNPEKLPQNHTRCANVFSIMPNDVTWHHENKKTGFCLGFFMVFGAMKWMLTYQQWIPTREQKIAKISFRPSD